MINNQSRLLAVDTSSSLSIRTDSQIAESSSYMAIRSSTPQNIICNRDLMFSYGMEGYKNPTIDPHAYCPMITQNCCTPTDATNSIQIWNTQLKPNIERYYEVYIHAIKYILGFSQEVLNLAKEFQESSETKCKNAAEDYINLDLTPKITMDVFKAISISLERVAEIRKGFYCIICDGRTHQKLSEYWSSSSAFNQNKLFLSKAFCEKLVEHTISASYFTIHYLKRLADNMGTLMNCKTGNSTHIEYEIPRWTQDQIKNCYFFRNKYFFFFCENYCEKFHLTKSTPVFDGDIGELQKYVVHIMENRHSAFKYSSNNILMDGVGATEELLRANGVKIRKDTVFIRPAAQKVMLEQYPSDVVYYGGVNPWESAEKALYQLVINSGDIMKALIACMLVLVIRA